jgi:hypothetical protein
MFQGMTPQSATQTGATYGSASIGSTLPFEAITQPGAYICHWSGHLLRVPEDGFFTAQKPVFSMVGAEPLNVTKISENPYITITKAKLLASNWDLSVNF